MNIVFDPCIFTLLSTGDELEESKHFSYLREIINFIDKYCSKSIMNTDMFYNDIIKTREHPWNQYKYFKTSMQETQKKILRNFSDQYHIVSNESKAKNIAKLMMPDSDESDNTSFLKTINYASKKNFEVVIYLGECNHKVKRPLKFICSGVNYEITAICNPMTESCKVHLDFLCCCEKLNTLPVLENLFPNADFCIELNREFKSKIGLSGIDRICLIEKTAHQIAVLNHFKYNPDLSKKNSKSMKSKRAIFMSGTDIYIYLSVDFESGGFEVFDHKKQHLGQYSFIGTRVKPPSPNTHKLL